MSSEPRSMLWRIIRVYSLTSPDREVMDESANHHRIYFIKANGSTEIPESAEYFSSGISDSKLRRITGTITAVSKAQQRVRINFAVPICLLPISSSMRLRLSLSQKAAVTNTGYSPRDLVI